MRLIRYIAPRTGEEFEFITNEMVLSPGIIMELYHRRWDVEKVFDELKNKLEEKKAWASSLEAKRVQAKLCAMTLNLLAVCENHIKLSTASQIIWKRNVESNGFAKS